MALTIGIDKVTQRHLDRLFRRAPVLMTDGVDRALEKTGSYLVNQEIHKNAPKADGRLRDSWSARRVGAFGLDAGSHTLEVFSILPYINAVEHGLKPRQSFPYYFPEFRKWIRLRFRGLSVGAGRAGRVKSETKQTRTIAYFVARKIWLRGTKAQPFIEKSIRQTQPVLNRNVAREVRILTRRLNRGG